MIFGAINWDMNPEIFRIGNFAVRWYGLLFASGFFFGYLIFLKIFKKEGLSVELLDKLTIYMALGTVIGARLGHCLFYEPEYYLSHPVEILKIWRGGLASHGAGIGILIALWLFVRKHKKPFSWVIDRIVVVVALAGACIRLGNLMNSEIYGVETTLSWGFVFIRNLEVVPKHPTQIYEALSYLLIFLLLGWIYIKTDGKPRPGTLFGIFLVLVFGMRFLIEFIKEDQVAFESGMSLNMGQWLSIPFVLAGVVLLVWSRRRTA
ncbi:prolipoprotein diacylglyceryl transferase [Bacteroidota bacterium]